jgi:ATP-dependent Clp protease ATP-binding subunit ClpC
VLETLCRKLKSNPLLIGKPGVGKTALVIAWLRVWAVTTSLSASVVTSLKSRGCDCWLANCSETENLQNTLEDVPCCDVILFFDEIHTAERAERAER